MSEPLVRLLAAALFLIAMAAILQNPNVLLPMVGGGTGMVCPPFNENCNLFLNDAHEWLREQFGMNHLRSVQAVALIPIEVGLIALALNKWRLAWFCLLAVFFMRLLPGVFFQFPLLNFNFYDIVFLAVFLFSKNKIFAAKVFFVLLYFASSTLKFDEGWISGDYFLTLKEGLPLVGQNVAAVVLLTNAVIVAQIFAGWALFSENKNVRVGAFVLFSIFHIYSAALVGLRFPMSTVPLLIILFAFDLQRAVPAAFKDYAGNILGGLRAKRPGLGINGFLLFMCGAVLLLQTGKILVPGNEKLSGEMSTMGLYMFEANHQCVSIVEGQKGADIQFIRQTANIFAQNRCTTWENLYTAREEFCRALPGQVNAPFDKYLFTFYSSVNGAPFYEIVAQADLCNVEYNTLGPNPWIRLDTENLTSFHVYENTYGHRGGSFGMLHFDAENDGLMHPDLTKQLDLRPIDPEDRPTLKGLNTILQVFYWLAFLGVTGLFWRSLIRAVR